MSVKIPGYKITRTLGRGGMATVYLAIQEVFEREVALKIMSKALAEDPNFGQRFFREAKIVSKLVHPNIVTVHDVGMHEGFCYLSMEYIDGKDLRRVIDKLNLRQKVQVVCDIAKALEYSGSKGYVHRDIKPENIMFHSSDGRAVLMDFGIARAAESDTMVTQAGTAIGTPHYMSPEQAKGKAVDGRSDIYSLGVVFFYMLAGRVPYDAESAVAIGIKHITEQIPLLPKAFEAFQPIIDKMLAKDVNERYQTARELMADVEEMDISLIEHKLEFIRQSAEARNSDVHDTPTLSHVGDEEAEAFEVDDEHITDMDAFPEYDLNDDTLVAERSSILPWFVAGVFIVSVLLTFIYYKHPEKVKPWLDSVLQKGSAIAALGGEEKSVQAETTDVTPKVEASQTKPVASIDPLASNPVPSALPQESKQTRTVAAEGTISRQQGAKAQKAAEIQRLQAGVARLQSAYEKDPIYLGELVAQYRELLALLPAKSAQADAFALLRKNEIDKAALQADKNGWSNAMAQRIEQLKVLFPEEDSRVFKRITDSAKQRKKVLSLVLEAEAYLKQNNLTRPEKRNALYSYNQALRLDKNNARAKQGKREIARRIAALATKRRQQGDLKSAYELAEQALVIDTSNRDARMLKNAIGAILDKNKQIDTLLRDAEKKIRNEQLFSPINQGAFHDLQQVLKLDPDNSAAKDGLERVLDALSAKVWRLVGSEQFPQAKESMRLAQQAFGSNERVESLALALDEVIGEKVVK